MSYSELRKLGVLLEDLVRGTYKEIGAVDWGCLAMAGSDIKSGLV